MAWLTCRVDFHSGVPLKPPFQMCCQVILDARHNASCRYIGLRLRLGKSGLAKYNRYSASCQHFSGISFLITTTTMRTSLLAVAAIVAATVYAHASSHRSFHGFDHPPITEPSRGRSAVCVSGIVSVQASTSKALRLAYQLPQIQAEVTEAFFTPGSAFSSQIVTGRHNANGTYKIGATLCTPANKTAPKGVQFLTRGV